MQYRDVLEENDNNNPKNQNQKLFEENQSVLDKDSFCNISVPKIAVTERQNSLDIPLSLSCVSLSFS